MKYSLRSLMIVVTLVAVMLGDRIEYLRRRAVFHEGEAHRFAKRVEAQFSAYGEVVDASDLRDNQLKEVRVYRHGRGDRSPHVRMVDRSKEMVFQDRHRSLGFLYRKAMRAPWTLVDESNVGLQSFHEIVALKAIVAKMPADEAAFESWIRGQHGVWAASTNRKTNTLEVILIMTRDVNGNPPIPNVREALDRLGYHGITQLQDVTP